MKWQIEPPRATNLFSPKHMNHIKEYWRNNPEILALIVGVAAHALVLFAILPAMSTLLSTSYGIGFADDYDKIALNLLNGNGYRFSPDTAETLMREPGYPFLLAATFSIFGYSLAAARLLNLFLVTGMAWLLILVVRAFTQDRLVCAAAVVLFLAHPGMVIAEARGGFEPLYAFCLVLFVWWLIRARSSQQKVDYFCAGICLGLGTLVRSSLIAFPIFALAWLLLRPDTDRKRRTIVVEILALSLGMCLVILPWMVRNYLVVHAVVPTATISGIAAHVGEYVCQNRDTGRSLQELDRGARDERAAIAREAGYQFEDNYFPFFFSAKDEAEFSRGLLKRAVGYYVANPRVFLQCASLNLINFWVAGKNALASSLNAVLQVPYLLLAVLGAIWITRRAGGYTYVTPILLVVLYTTALHAVTFAQARYSIPLVPLLAVLGAHPFARFWLLVARRR
mgnify:CR=1 FL=1